MPSKAGGAYCMPVTPRHHPYVMLNFTGKLRDVTTLAHELGHVIWHKQYQLGPRSEIACYNSNFASSWQHPNSGKGRRWTEFDDETIDKHPDANIKMPKAATTPAEMADLVAYLKAAPWHCYPSTGTNAVGRHGARKN